MAPYSDNFEHLRDELRRLDLLLERAVLQFRHRRGRSADAPFAGLYISDADVDAMLANDEKGSGEEIRSIDARIAAKRDEIAQRIEESRAAGTMLRLPYLAQTFDLDSAAIDIILLALAPELDLRYQKLYAYIQDDVGRRRPSVDLALRLLYTTEQERLKGRRLFADISPLFSIPLLTRHDDPADRPALLLGQFLKLEERIVEFLAGGDFLESRLGTSGGVRWALPRVRLEDLVMTSEMRDTLARLAGDTIDEGKWLCILEGAAGSGKKSIAEGVCTGRGETMLVIDVRALASGNDLRGSLRAALREARLYGGAVYLDRCEELLREDQGSALEMVRREIEGYPGNLFIASREPWRADIAGRRTAVHLRIPIPDDTQRLMLWQRALGNGLPVEKPVDIAYLAGAFRFTGGRIRNALRHARTQAQLHGNGELKVTERDIIAGCRTESSRAIIAYSKKITPKRTWDDLILPKDIALQLREFCRQVRWRTKVYGEWGFDAKLSSGKGTIALFTGTSGTGKTLSAEVMAKELGIDLFRVDLASVISKYIGETEKNLSRVFQDAQESNAILFFDEADAIFGKRSEVKDAHDRYANIEINYLLQRVEEYEGVVILASNLSKNIDPAFLRRLHFSIEFPFPDEWHRLQIWRRIFPSATPVAPDIDFEFMARQFKIAGGNIRNVALAAAFHAAEEESMVTMEHLISAMKREYQKLGRTCERNEFEQYYERVR